MPRRDWRGRPLAHVARVADLPGVLGELGVRLNRPVVVLIGGAGGMSANNLRQADGMLRAAVFPALDRCDVVVVDGGTDSGVMRVVGRAREATGGRFPLVGVAAQGTAVESDVAQPNTTHVAALEPHHTHVILVPGQSWGEESPWLAHVATAIARDQPSVTLAVNGGKITYDDIDQSLAANRPVFVIAGTGRAADEIAVAAAGYRANCLRAERIAASPLVQIFDVGDFDAIADALSTALLPRQPLRP